MNFPGSDNKSEALCVRKWLYTEVLWHIISRIILLQYISKLKVENKINDWHKL